VLGKAKYTGGTIMNKLPFHLSLWAAGVIFYCLFPSLLFAATQLRIGYSAITTTQAPLWAAQDRGIFTKYGIEPELIYLAGGSKIALALESNSIQLGRFNVNSAVDASLAGGHLVVIGSFYDYYYFQIFGKPTIKNPADLKGKVIAASTAGSASDYGVREALGRFGLKDTDYRVLYTGGTDARVQALQLGLADAAIISPPNGLIAQKLGFKEIMNLMEMKLLFGYGGLAAKESWLKQNRETVLNFFKSYLEALAVLRQDREYALKVIGKFTRISDRDVLLESYRTSVPQMPTRPYVKKEIVEKALKMSRNEAARRADAEKLYDNSFVKTLDDAGFMKSLFGNN
jgi:NitT/TauT family transport system substrate-binding protein